MMDDLIMGDTFYSPKHDVLFYRHDGVNTIVYLPEGKTVDTITPFYAYTMIVLGDDTPCLEWTDNPPQYDELIKITLKDNA